MRQLGFVLCLTLASATAETKVSIEPRVATAPPSSRARSANLSVTSNSVVVPVTVLDAKGAPVLGLRRERFRVFEDGVEQTIKSFGQEETPVSIGIVFDSSRSMEPKMEQAREAIAALFTDAAPEDEFHLVEFNDAPRMMCNLTKDTAEVRRALDAIEARGWTALFDGIFLSAQRMRQAHNPRRALVILSDGADNFSRYQESELRSYLREAGVVVYSIALLDGPSLPSQTRPLRRISRDTGGWSFAVNRKEKLTETVRAIGVAIRSQYVLSYTPTNTASDGKLRRIGLEFTADKSARLATSWRTGYYAADSR
jgi:VWFA-related protein